MDVNPVVFTSTELNEVIFQTLSAYNFI